VLAVSVLLDNEVCAASGGGALMSLSDHVSDGLCVVVFLGSHVASFRGCVPVEVCAKAFQTSSP
jgi:hypothetical protein